MTVGHTIQGLIVSPEAAAKATAVHGAVPVALNASSLAFIPMTDALFDQLATLFPDAVDEAYGEFWKLSPSGSLWMREVSTAGRVAYVETEYFGGGGAQAAAVWEAGQSIYGPKLGAVGPVNEALRLLGVVRTQTDDEFAVAGLHRHRSNDDWLAG